MEEKIKVKLLDKECTVYKGWLIAAGHMNVQNNETLEQFLSLIYNEQFAYVFMDLFSLDGISEIIGKTYRSMEKGEDLTIEVPNNFKTINHIHNLMKEAEECTQDRQ